MAWAVASSAGRGVGEPFGEQAHQEGRAVFVGTEQVLRRVAGAAMAQSLDQIGAAIPVGRLVGPGPEARLVEEQQVPAAQQAAMAERPDQIVREIGRASCRERGCQYV